MKLYDGGFLFLVILGLFSYGVYHLDKNTDGGKQPVNFQEIKSEIVEDYNEVTDKLENLEVESANHDRYND